MTMIGLFFRQAVHATAGNRGQATTLFVVVSGTLLAVVFAGAALHHYHLGRQAAAEAIDSIALSAATWEARGLNLIAALNDGAIQCMRVIRWTTAIWAVLAISAAFGAGVPAFLAYTRQARRIISGYWDTAHLLVTWSGKIRSAVPYLVLAETASLSRKRNVTGTLYPWNPRGPHDGKETLELHVSPGPPVSLVEAMAPVTAAIDRLKKVRILKGVAKTVVAALDAAIRGILGNAKGPIRMLAPEPDFRERQRVRFTGFLSRAALPVPILGESGVRRFPSTAEAEPYGGKQAEMTWKSRLAESSSP
ncbi:MAG TPA: hypothetical protein VF853_03825 [Candidatus Deferrimicrobiaceae bacterium]